MNEIRDRLYREMMIAYQTWADLPRPPLMTEHSQDEVIKKGYFREAQWRDYVKARDSYLSFIVRGHAH